MIACAALIAAVFGKGGGDEARRAQLLSALKDRLGDREGEQVWDDLREVKDPETSVSIDGNFNQQAHKGKNRKGNAIIDADSLDTSAAESSAVAQASQQSASNAVLVGAEKSATGKPFFVAGPQVGYFYPQVLMRDRRARRRHRRPRRDVPRRRPVRRARPRHRLLVERDLRGQRQHRHLRRGAVR